MHHIYTVLSPGSADSRASAYPPILTVSWFFEVLHVTVQHAKFLHIYSESEVRSAELTYIAAIIVLIRFGCRDIRHQKFAHTPPSFAALFPCSTKFAYSKRRLDAAETWQRGYEPVRFVARYMYSFFHCRVDLKEARTKRRCGTPWQLTSHPG